MILPGTTPKPHSRTRPPKLLPADREAGLQAHHHCHEEENPPPPNPRTGCCWLQDLARPVTICTGSWAKGGARGPVAVRRGVGGAWCPTSHMQDSRSQPGAFANRAIENPPAAHSSQPDFCLPRVLGNAAFSFPAAAVQEGTAGGG